MVRNGNGNGLKSRVAVWYAVAIFVVWASSFGFGAATGDFTPFSIATPALFISAGFLFGFKPGGKNGNGI